MTRARLRCRDCGWQSTARRPRAATRAARRHRCAPLMTFDQAIPTHELDRDAEHDEEPVMSHTPARRRWDDGLLYPTLLNPPCPEHRWHRLGHVLGICSSVPASVRRHQQTVTDGIRGYQRELAFRSQMVLRDRVQAGWWLGPAPYGYQLIQHNTSPRRSLTLDTARAAVVPVIYRWFVNHPLMTSRAIAARLVTEPDRFPLPMDHVSGQPRQWSPAIVRTILINPAYLGYVVRHRTQGGRPCRPGTWVWSIEPSHPALIDAPTFWAAYDRTFPRPMSEPDESSQRGAA
ncbi:recombinase family protein [Kibdelosporangium philippinense]|uniref:Recombinase family protein n=1 Tax=Kibdelosporangium philippinense TaxID=211113 RepID=A0ABS8ZHN4_9PSEU|nr:recombinase family protein [Kibdelosporangium philippinense]MCE7007067.1 recombinase family protein [Kibdelosporangium philippinense]